MKEVALTLTLGLLLGILGTATYVRIAGPVPDPEVVVVTRAPDPPAPAAPVTTVPTTPAPVTTSTAPDASPPVPTASPTPRPQPSIQASVAPVPVSASGRSTADWLAVADRLSSAIQLPSDCGLPLDEPASMPNSPREYRGGVHQGIDFICSQTGRQAIAAMDGRVAMAMSSWVEPSPAERSALLATATTLGRTPPWTLAFLFGRFVVLDHGLIADVGHVYSIYAHMAAVDPAIRQGVTVPAGAVLGEIGNAGTSAAGTGEDNPRSLHLHWELFIDNTFLGDGAGPADTAQIYERLFG